MKLVIITGGSTAHHHCGKLLPATLIVCTLHPLITRGDLSAERYAVLTVLAETEHH